MVGDPVEGVASYVPARLARPSRAGPGIGRAAKTITSGSDRAEMRDARRSALLADAYGGAGQPETGVEVILDALASSARSGEVWWRAELRRLEAELRLKVAAPDEAAVEHRLLEARGR